MKLTLLVSRPRGAGQFGELPSEILAKVFRALADAQAGAPCAPSLSLVCRHWRNAVSACESSLYSVCDLSYGWLSPSDAVLRRLCERGAWARLSSLSLADCRTCGDATLALLGEHCPALSRLNLTGGVYSQRGLKACASALSRQLRDLVLDRITLTPVSEFDRTLKAVAEALPLLTSISCRSCPRFTSAGLRALLCCPGLRVLDLTAAGGMRHGIVLPIEAMQAVRLTHPPSPPSPPPPVTPPPPSPSPLPPPLPPAGLAGAAVPLCERPWDGWGLVHIRPQRSP